MSDAEYDEHRRAYLSAATRQRPSANSIYHPAIRDNLAKWLKVEKQLYREIEKQVSMAGYDMRRLVVNAGADYSAAHAEYQGSREGGFFGGHSSVDGYLKIDYLGDDVWYARGVPNPRAGRASGAPLGLEFLVCATREIAGTEHDRWVSKGRGRQPEGVMPPSRWRTTLPNGAIVEFIGICESPSAGKP